MSKSEGRRRRGHFSGPRLRFRRPRDTRWPLWVCALGNLASAPLLLVFLLFPHAGTPSFVCWSLGSFSIGFFSAPTGAVAQSLTKPNMRALAHAIWSMVLNLGLGPLFVGMLAGAWTAASGDDAIRYAIAAATSLAPLSAWLFWRAGQDLPGDLARVGAEVDGAP